MQRTKLKDRIMPIYSRGEEIFNMVSHIAGGALGIAGITMCIILAALHHNVYGVVSGSIFGGTLILLYTMSSIYHGLPPESMAKRVFQIIDHCSIFLLIAGTYTPLSLCALREANAALGWTVFGITWSFAILGIVLNSIDLKMFKKFSIICYLAMGWGIIIKGASLPQLLGAGGFAMLLAGGLFYTAGAVLYILGKKRKWLHSVFHIFCVFGSVLHLFCVMFYVV